MYIEAVGPFDVEHCLMRLEKNLVGHIPIDCRNQEAHANAIDKHDPQNKFHNADEMQLHDQPERNCAHFGVYIKSLNLNKTLGFSAYRTYLLEKS